VIRPATIEDMDWLMSVAATAYPEGTYEEGAGRAYWKAIIESGKCLLLRGEKAAMGAMIVQMPYAPTVRFATLLPVMSSGNAGMELMKMTRKLVDWAKLQGAERLDFSALTGVDLGPLAKRFGGVPVSPAYTVRFENV
jgi:hypothetical protein